MLIEPVGTRDLDKDEVFYSKVGFAMYKRLGRSTESESGLV